MSSRNKDERAHVNALIAAIMRNSKQTVYTLIDRDAGGVRHTSSGWDFLVACGGRVAFCEAKEGKGKLSDWQEYTQALVQSAKTPYRVVRFWEDGKYFSIEDSTGHRGQYETKKASVTDFLNIGEIK